ncbi:MerR family transcriptional regulator [Heliorestis acidaminivorans]|nr:MerR family transcriptional regulator [Heliorestis acidaminivorans]
MMVDNDNVVGMWYLIKEIANLTGIAENTLRRYADLFGEFFIVKKYGRSTKYNENSIELFRNIFSMYEEGYSTEEIREKLTKENMQILDMQSNSHEITTVPQQLVSTLTGIESALQGIKEEMKKANENRDEIEKLKNEFQEFRMQQEQIKVENEKLMKYITETREEEKKKSIWSKLFNK